MRALYIDKSQPLKPAPSAIAAVDPSAPIQRTRPLLDRVGWARRRHRARPIAGGSRGRSDGRDASPAPLQRNSGAVATVDWK